MPNSVTRNPMVITGSLPSFKAALAAAAPGGGIQNSSFGTLQTLIVERWKWSNPGTSQTLSIGDPVSGEVLELLRSDSSGDDVIVDLTANPKIIDDFSVNSFAGGGALYVYTR
jgi:hypothetical protein